MVDASNPEYQGTLQQIDEIRSMFQKLDISFSLQVPQGLKAKFDNSKAPLCNWLEEIEFTLQEFYKTKCQCD